MPSSDRIIRENRYDNLPFISNDCAYNNAPAVYNNAYLSPYFSGKFCQVSSEFRLDNEAGWDPAPIYKL